jgi:hypothetical protein
MERVAGHNEGEVTTRETRVDGVLLTICKARGAL